MRAEFFVGVCAAFILAVSGITVAHAEDGGDVRASRVHDCRTTNCFVPLIPEALKSSAQIGKPAPDFTLEGVSGKEFTTLGLQDFREKWLVFFFYPADFTFVCPTELKGFNDSIESFRKLNAEIVAVSTDSKWSHLAWIKRGDLGNLKYPLLSDFNKETARAYGVLDAEKGVALRGLFIIDPKGILQYQVVHNLDVGRSVEETIRVLEALQSGGLCPLGWKPGQKTLRQ
jgi:alkyl hydroperoxide reductase subunit AhpC